MLMDAGLWRYAATLAAHALPRDEQATALERWAAHIHQVQHATLYNSARNGSRSDIPMHNLQAEADLWRALGVLTAAGALRAAVQLLRKSGFPDCAAAYVDAACKAGVASSSPALEAGRSCWCASHSL